MDKNNYTDQAYLIWAILQDESLLKKSEDTNRRFVKEITGIYEPQNVISKITSGKSTKNPGQKTANIPFFTLENHKLSSLTPELRFFRADRDSQTPFYFPINSKFDETAGGGEFTSNANSVESFKVEYQGTDLYTSSRYLSCNLVLKVDSLANIFKEPPEGFARLADLFALRKTAGASTVGGTSAGQSPQPIEVVATLGYSILNRGIFTQEEIAAIEETFQIVRMNVSDYSFDLQQNGTATINISYTARVEQLGSKNRAAFFSATSSPKDIVDAANLDIFTLDEKAADSTNNARATPRPNKVSDTEDRTQLQQLFLVLEIINGFSEAKFNNNLRQKFESYSYSADDLTPNQSILSLSNNPPKSSPMSDSDQLTFLHNKVRSYYDGKSPVSFVFLGDLIEAMFIKAEGTLSAAISTVAKSKDKKEEKAKKNKIITDKIQTLKRFSVLLQNISLSYLLREKKTFNLASLPVSIPVIYSYFFEKFLDVKANSFTIKDFLDSIDIILKKALASNSVKQFLDQETKFKKVQYSGPIAKKKIKASVDVNDVPQFNTRNLDANSDYYIIYQDNSPETTSPSNNANPSSDSEKGIYHIYPGQDRGLVKNINFAKFDVPYKREALMTEKVGLYDELMMPYSATVEMFGNNLFLPGAQIYIDPYSIGFGDPTDRNSAAVKLGFGGYYTILSVSTSIARGTMSTTLQCSFGSFPTEVTALDNKSVTTVTENSGIDAMITAETSKSSDQKAQPRPTANPVPASLVTDEGLYNV